MTSSHESDDKRIVFNGWPLRGVVKNGYFTVRLTVRVDPPTPSPLRTVFLNFLWCVQKNRVFGPKALFEVLF